MASNNNKITNNGRKVKKKQGTNPLSASIHLCNLWAPTVPSQHPRKRQLFIANQMVQRECVGGCLLDLKGMGIPQGKAAMEKACLLSPI